MWFEIKGNTAREAWKTFGSSRVELLARAPPSLQFITKDS